MTTFGVLQATVALTFTCATLFSSSVSAAPPICFNCTHLPGRVNCKDFNSCKTGEECFHETVETESGNALFSWGCASTQLCKLEQGLTGRRKRLNIQRCFECCTDSFCNFGTCQTDFCANVACQNNAPCKNTPLGHVCECQAGYTGSLCQTDINECAPYPCLNGGTCSDLIGKYTCSCLPGYTGTNCETDINECASNPCLNGAHCTDEVAQYSCRCLPGYTGRVCETDINECDSLPCVNNGTCTDLVNDYSCSCLSGWSGKDCEINIDDCVNVTCLNGGVCNDYVGYFGCKCALGFAGTYCEQSLGRVCYSCANVSDVTSCQNQVICAKNEECFMEHELYAPGTFNFNSGCVPTQMCAYLQNNGITRRGNNAIQLCYECCDANDCNNHACVASSG